MNYLTVTNLSKSFSNKPLFESIDFRIDKYQKIALIAKNGAGKSTLLKVLTWEIDRSDGTIERRKWIKLSFLNQDLRLDPDMLVIDTLFDADNELVQLIKKYEQLTQNQITDDSKLHETIEKMEELDARSYETKVKTIVSKLQIAPYLHQTIDSLSWGEAKRVALAKVLVDEPDFLILDEPTNHLDLDMTERLENYLCTQNITLLMITHDRYFLERICTDIFELNRGKLYKYPGNYSYFLEKKAQRQEHEALYMKNQRKLLKQELAWIRKSPRARASKSIHREKKFHNIEDNYDIHKAIIQWEKKSLDITTETRRLGKKICKIHNLQKKYGDKIIIKDFSYDFKQGERVGIVGKNGVGKSTFVRMLLDEESFDSGKITIGETVLFGHYQQKETEFKDDQRVIDVVKNISEYMHIGKNKRISASKALENFLFPTDQQYTLANKLSWGEKKRLNLLTILMKNPNFLILDEPTNDVDLLTLAVVEEFLLQYQGCLIVISHDRFFIDKIVDHLFVFKGEGQIQDFWWTYSEYKIHEKKAIQLGKKLYKQVEKRIDANLEPTKKKLSYYEKREFEQLEKELEVLEKRKDQINRLFDNKDLPYDDIKKLSEELAEVMKHIERCELRWMELSKWM